MGVDRYHGRGCRELDEALVQASAVQVGPADRDGERPVRPVDIAGVHRHAGGVARAGDEALVDAVRAVQVGPADRVGAELLSSRHVLGVDRHATGIARAGDEALVRVRAVEVGPADRVGVEVGPVDVAGVDRHARGRTRR